MLFHKGLANEEKAAATTSVDQISNLRSRILFLNAPLILYQI